MDICTPRSYKKAIHVFAQYSINKFLNIVMQENSTCKTLIIMLCSAVLNIKELDKSSGHRLFVKGMEEQISAGDLEFSFR
jgi:hypothetical protein